jgi:RNA polymerase sigma-70 factor (ECF subfamily)
VIVVTCLRFGASNINGGKHLRVLKEVYVTETDEELVQSALTGNGVAFEKLVARHQQNIYRMTLRLTGNTSDADDILQETFFTAFRKLKSFRGHSQFGTWLYRIAVNSALMHLRQRKRRTAETLQEYLPRFRRDGRHRRIDTDYSAGVQAEKLIERRELRELLLNALARMPYADRTAVVLVDLEEKPAAEAAAILGIKAPTLRQRVHRARLMLRGYLDEMVRGRRQ